MGKAITSRSDVGAGHQHHHAVEAEGDAAVRRRAVARSASSRKPKRASRLLLADAEQPEDPLLHLGVVDADRAAAELDAVEHHVVGARAHRAGIALELVEVARVGAR